MCDTQFVQERLSNGLRVVIEVMPQVRSAACGFLARTGARDDPPELAGLAHFLEHMMFKGTAGRTWQQLNIEFDEIGSFYNAYTSKERTFYYSWAQTQDLDRQLDLLADMMRSVLPPEELALERNVVLEEIAMANDDLESSAYDFLYEQVCAGSTLAWPVLGYERTIKSMTREAVQAWFVRQYSSGNLILVVAGDVDPDAVLCSVQQRCGSWTAVNGAAASRPTPQLRTGQATRQLARFHQQALLLVFPSVPAGHPMEETAQAVAAILGGTNSRFYWNIVQQGISSRAGVFEEEYIDFSLMVMYGLCEPANCEKLYEAMRRQVADFVREGPQPKEIQRVKNLRRTALATESEAPFYRLGQIVDDVEYHGAPRPAEERLAAVDAVSAETIAAYLREFPIEGEGLLASVGPRDWPDKNRFGCG